MDDTNVKLEETVVIAEVKDTTPKERRLAVDIPANLFDQLDAEAERTGDAKKDIVHDALVEYLNPNKTAAPRPKNLEPITRR